MTRNKLREKEETTIFPVKMPESMQRELNMAAKATGMKKAQMVRAALQLYLEKLGA